MTPAAQRPSALAVAVALGTVYIVWGSTYLAIAYVVESMPPLLSAGARFLAAGSILVAFLLARHQWRKARGADVAGDGLGDQLLGVVEHGRAGQREPQPVLGDPFRPGSRR